MVLFRRRKLSGNGLVEYVLLTAMVTVASIGVFQLFRDNITQAAKKVGEILISQVDQSLAQKKEGE